ncbi:MAG TPA: glycosyltransferase family 39 protein, partial [Chitinophagaceae bacterium]|nr:glycosyltransferase family 39 protein [Chitinophagaceae bacterium]
MDFLHNTRWHYVALFLLAFLLYANTLHHGFVLDDEVVLSKNTFVQKGIKGIPEIFSYDSFAGYEKVGAGKSLLPGGRYRPLSIAFFAIIHSVFGMNPLAYHLFAVLLYILICVLLYKLLLLVLKDRSYGKWIAALATLIFVVHPIHTEVVANIKSCDEQLALLFGLAAFYSVFKWWDTKQILWTIASFILFLLACFAKEISVVLILLIPLALLFFRESHAKELWKYAIPLLVAGAVFLFLRISVINDQAVDHYMLDPLNNPFVEWVNDTWVPVPAPVKAATIIYTFGQYVRLMVFPYPLTHDYYPYHIAFQKISSPWVILSLLMLIISIVYGLLSIRRKGIIGFGVLFFVIPLIVTANIFFPVGTFMAERFLFFPSVGFALAAAVVLVYLAVGDKKKYVLPAIAGITLIMGVMTVFRNNAWKSNETLFTTDISVSSGSVKLRNDLGTVLLIKALETNDTEEKQKLFKEAYDHLKVAINSHKTYYDAFLAYGASAYYIGDYEQAVNSYSYAYELNPQDSKSQTGLLYSLQAFGVETGKKGEADKAVNIFTNAWHLQPDTTSALELSKYYAVLNQPEESVKWLEEAVNIATNEAYLKYKLAQAYHQLGRRSKADSVYR